jgi:hypothetical protein
MPPNAWARAQLLQLGDVVGDALGQPGARAGAQLLDQRALLGDIRGFSDERLLRAVAAASTPIVSAIGHENDHPLLDDVAGDALGQPGARAGAQLLDQRALLGDIRDHAFGGIRRRLLGFSDERLLRAVAAASTPIVSAIGHENDHPLLDGVNRVRARARSCWTSARCSATSGTTRLAASVGVDARRSATSSRSG